MKFESFNTFEGSIYSIHSHYLEYIFNPRLLRFIVRETARMVDICRKKSGANKILVTGISGLSVGFPVANRLKMPICVVRKSLDGSHGEAILENHDLACDRFIFVDDFIGTGCTIKKLRNITRDNIIEVVLHSGDARDNQYRKAADANFPVEHIHFIRWKENIPLIDGFGILKNIPSEY